MGQKYPSTLNVPVLGVEDEEEELRVVDDEELWVVETELEAGLEDESDEVLETVDTVDDAEELELVTWLEEVVVVVERVLDRP